MNTENMILKAGYVKDFDYMYAEDGIEDLIYIKAGLSSFAKNPAGGLSFLSGEFAVRGRAFTGADGGDADKEAFNVYALPETRHGKEHGVHLPTEAVEQRVA